MPLFDPLRTLRHKFYATPEVGPDGIGLTFEGRTTEETRREALAIVRGYEAVLRLQLKNGGASVQKLIAHGKLRPGDVRA